jgi:hypothetical protein
MALFSRGVPRLFAVAFMLAGFCIVPPEALSQGPDLCLWRILLHLSECPACGSMHALAAFFHGRFSDALAYNRNVLVTGPLLLMLAATDLSRLVSSQRGRARAKRLGADL